MTEDKLNEIETRAKAATPGPWYVPIEHEDEVCAGDVAEGQLIGDVYHPPNAEFVAHAREDVPALVAEVREQRQWVAILEETMVAYRMGLDGMPEPRGLTDAGLEAYLHAANVRRDRDAVRAALRKCIAHAGAVEAAHGCRLVIATAKEALGGDHA